MAAEELEGLGAETREKVLECCRQVLRLSGFLFKDQWARLITGPFLNLALLNSMMEWEGRMNIAMSNTVTTAIHESVRDMAIGKTKTTEKADRATVEQAIDPRTHMVLFKMLNRDVFHDMNGSIATGKEPKPMVKNLQLKYTKHLFWYLRDEQGISSWVAVNYALGNLERERQETTGIVELGGASLQCQQPTKGSQVGQFFLDFGG